MMTLYPKVWDRLVSKDMPVLIYWRKLLYPVLSATIFFRFFLRIESLELWGWDLWTDKVYITLSQLCTAVLF